MTQPSSNDLGELLNQKIAWLAVTGEPKWIAAHKGQKFTLVMNDFPEEPLYTVTDGTVSLDIEDAPADWLIPHY